MYLDYCFMCHNLKDAKDFDIPHSAFNICKECEETIEDYEEEDIDSSRTNLD